MKRIVVVGAGIGGLIAGGLLAKRGCEVMVLERSPILGGRSHVMEKDGVHLPYGAHALLVKNVPPVKQVLAELGMNPSTRAMSLSRFKLMSGGKLVSSPLGPGLLTSRALGSLSKRLKFVATYLKLGRVDPDCSLGFTVQDWLKIQGLDPEVEKVLHAYLALTLYDNGLDSYSMNRLAEHTLLTGRTLQPVSYVDYRELLSGFTNAIEQHGGSVRCGSRVEGLVVDGGRVCGVVVNGEEILADHVILNLPPRDIIKLTDHASLQEEVAPLAVQPPSQCYVYDLVLSKPVCRKADNVLDLDRAVYINDLSANIPSCAPQGQQVLACLKFLTAEEQADDTAAERARQDVEAALDDACPGWRDAVVGRRIIDRAVVNGIARRVGSRLLPLHSSALQGLSFVGDSTEGQGALGVPAYDSAWRVANALVPANVVR
ncbi:MAG: FAD-dependent oxidoreductase [Tumebacillaceae bacterium]